MQGFFDTLVYGLWGLNPQLAWVQSLHFFLYDGTKILFLLLLITTLMSIVQRVFPVQKLQALLNSRKWFGLDYVLAALFGALTPFCSCSSVPLFIGFVRGGIPLGVTLAFLITSPLVNEAALALFWASFGLKFTLIYALAGVVMGVLGGMVLSLSPVSRSLQPWVLGLLSQGVQGAQELSQDGPAFVRLILMDLREILGRIWLWVLLGLGLGAVMHGYVPTGALAPILRQLAPWDVPVAVLLGVPLYASAAGVVPLVQVLVDKGVPLGTSLALMMATVGLSFPEAMMLKQVMVPRFLALFFGVVAAMMIGLGYFFNLIF